MLEKLILTSRTTEVDDVSARTIGAYKKTSLNSDPNLVTIFGELEPASQSLTSAIRRMKVESELEAGDENRDDRLRALNYLIQGFMHHPDLAIKAAATKVDKVFENYGLTIIGESYASESSLISSLLNDLAKPNLQNEIAALSGVAGLIAELQTAQADFEATRIAYEEEKAKEGTLENATSLKKLVVDLINEKLVVYLKAMLLVNEAAYGDYARTVSGIIATNNEAVKKRRKKTAPVES